MGIIKIIGLGSSELEQLPLGVYRTIKQSDKLYVRTKDHPIVKELEEEGIEMSFFDEYYEKFSSFKQVYPAIVEKLLKLSENKDIVYAVPGHPMVAEKSVQLLLESGKTVEIVGGKSFIDDMFQAVAIDPVDGFQLLDAFDLSHDEIQTGQAVIVMQVFNQLMASEVKLTLMELYPDDHQVCRIDAAGSRYEEIKWMPLYELDRFEGVHNLRSVYIPPLKRDERVRSFELLQLYIDEITSENGDVWIREQTPKSLLAYLKEETNELIQAYEQEDMENVIEELGDVLLQILYHTNLAEKTGQFSLEEVLEAINRKLRRRHPHVFDGISAETVEEVNTIWQEIKKKEKEERR
ncbi:tetrapyrrole methylase family protein / MazG family protein [Marinilactibacillus piezotolerans]|uniref:Tetrapyrrole methylase family protein / MazG family protein n=1 Tax=Marinilactibacillus piezotolerans TaxID=258723 RepID=A0A1I3Z536_9LACT|nr:MazG nucleotide pyrophosphohydrolase domain-containing protein [Marinilactibacillus piezotolerans]SFK39214.1 tetrapyrrole methylase family protein / MazG family protein [Marinilactibacillus piezotolerans]